MSFLMQLGLANAACALALALAAAVASRFRVRPALVHSLWLLVLIKLVTPPAFPFPIADDPFTIEEVADANARAPAAAPPAQLSQKVASAKVPPAPQVNSLLMEVIDPDMPAERRPALVFQPLPDEATLQPVTTDSAPNHANMMPAPSPRWVIGRSTVQSIEWLWLCGMAVWFCWVVVRVTQFQRLLRLAWPAPDDVQAQADRLAARLGLAAPPTVWLLPGPMPPMIWAGIGRPRLLFPSGLVTRLSMEERESLLTHELAHIRRRDHWVRWLELVVLGLYWWFPLAWWVRRQIQIHEEECCDAWVVADLPPRVYAAAIMETIDFLAENQPCVPLLASGLGRLHYLKRRLLMIFGRNTPKRLSALGRFAVAAVACVLLPWQPTLAQPSLNVTSIARLSIPAQPEPESAPAQPARRRLVELMEWTETCPASILSAAMTMDGKTLALALEDRTVVVRDRWSERVQCRLTAHDDIVTCLAFSPDGATLATGSPDKTVKLWNVADGQEIRTIRGHTSWVYALAFSRDGRFLASGGYDKAIHVWSPQTGQLQYTLQGHQAAVRALAFAPDGRTLASGGNDRTVRIWDVPGRIERISLREHLRTVRALAFSPNGQTLASASEDGVARLWDPQTGLSRAVLRGHTSELWSLAFAADGTKLITAGLERYARIWDVASGRLLSLSVGHRDGISAVLAMTDEEQVLTASHDRTVRQWRLGSGLVFAGQQEAAIPRPGVAAIRIEPIFGGLTTSRRRLAVPEMPAVPPRQQRK